MQIPDKIETARLYLSPMSEKYADVVFKELTLEITKFMSVPVTGNIDDTYKWLSTISPQIKNGTDFTIAIIDKKTGEFLGGGGLHHLDTTTPTLGIWIKKSAHGNRFGQEAVKGLTDWVNSNLNYEYLVYTVAVKNIASRRIPESLGGKIFRKYYAKNGASERMQVAEYRIPSTIQIDKVVLEIMQEIDGFINNKSIAIDQIASYIVGSTMMRDDYEDIIVIEPKIEELAEMASDFEVTSPDYIYIGRYYNEIIDKIRQIKKKYKIA